MPQHIMPQHIMPQLVMPVSVAVRFGSAAGAAVMQAVRAEEVAA